MTAAPGRYSKKIDINFQLFHEKFKVDRLNESAEVIVIFQLQTTNIVYHELINVLDGLWFSFGFIWLNVCFALWRNTYIFPDNTPLCDYETADLRSISVTNPDITLHQAPLADTSVLLAARARAGPTSICCSATNEISRQTDGTLLTFRPLHYQFIKKRN